MTTVAASSKRPDQIQVRDSKPKDGSFDSLAICLHRLKPVKSSHLQLPWEARSGSAQVIALGDRPAAPAA
jgi:hypothetical protein